MQLSKLELSTLHQIALGEESINLIAKELQRDKSRIYRAKQELLDKDLITFSNKTIKPQKKPLVTLLLQILSDHPQLIPLLSNSGIPILTLLRKSHSISEIQKQTQYQKSMIYQKINQAKKFSIITKTNSNYKLNKKIWPDLTTFLDEISLHEQTTDKRVPANSKIYYKTENEILFSNKQDLNATKTAFSAYNSYDIPLFLPTNFYILPKQQLSPENILIHSLIITKIDKSIRNITYVALFYLKYRHILGSMNHHILENIEKILQGKQVPGYPTKVEILQKADLYDIKF